MAEKFLTLMADLDDESQAKMEGWYAKLQEAGFTGTQTKGLPYHFSMSAFPVEKEHEAVLLTKKIASEFSVFHVHISHIGIFPGGRVLFGAPERNRELDALHDACKDPKVPWTPHVTILIDEPQIIGSALPVLINSFEPFIAKVTRLHLCEFWPTREICTAELRM